MSEEPTLGLIPKLTLDWAVVNLRFVVAWFVNVYGLMGTWYAFTGLRFLPYGRHALIVPQGPSSYAGEDRQPFDRSQRVWFRSYVGLRSNGIDLNRLQGF